MKYTAFKFFLFCCISIVFIQATAQIPAFPGAEGAGKYATGGRGGKVIYVSNLNDAGPGSLRYALSEVDGPRIILFSISGTIFLKTKIDVSKGDFTIAGQSAPGQGICIAGDGMDIEADNIIIQYLRFRPGSINQDETDALTIKRSDQVIIDHCSMSWSTDETCSCYDNTNFTLQWSIISESLNKSVHRKGAHGYGGIWGGKTATFHHNLLAHHKSRNPRLHGSRYHKEPELERAEVVNNVIYNWKSTCMYGGENGNYTIAGNYFKPGPATGKSASVQLLEPYEPVSSYYFNNNYLDQNPELSNNNWDALDYEGDFPAEKQLKAPLSISDYTIVSAKQAYLEILKSAGASLYRDAVDKRIIKEVKKGTSTYGENGIINSQKETGEWPQLKSKKAPADSDADGMPDRWEKKNQLNPNDPSDGNHYSISKQYTNVEVYLHSLIKL